MSHHQNLNSLTATTNGNGMLQNMGGSGNGPTSSKSMGNIRSNNKMNKYNNDNINNSHHVGGPDGIYEPRNDRSPNILPPQHHMTPNNSNINSCVGGSSNGSGHDPMNAMMNMFNPMMQAFLQQLTNGITPNTATASQATLDAPASGSHQWQPQGGPGGGYNSNNNNSGYNQNGGGGGGHRFKGERNLTN
jgi:hypothetical protein